MENAKMRFYAAGNMYLSSIQQGIQAAHCVSEMFANHGDNEYLWRWAKHHKTLICVNGGNNAKMTEFWEFLDEAGDKNPYPWMTFCEDEASMAGMLTCVGIIIPDTIYETDLNDPVSCERLGPWELELAIALKRMPLAR